MNGFLLIIPFLLIRFGLLSILDKEALKRAALFAPVIGSERVAYWFYQISNILIFVYICTLKITADSHKLALGIAIYGIGLFLCFWSVLNFSRPTENGINLKGLYRVSRNPMYVSYFVYFLGCVFLTQSKVLFVIVLVFQISAHWIILSEERWCIQKFGKEYLDYMDKVRRYV